MTSTIAPRDAKARVHGGGEIAFLDVREAGQFGEGHPLFVVPCAYSRLELDVEALVPNLRVPVVLIDGGDGVSEKAARRLEGLGYRDVSIVAGGAPAWAAAGLTLYKGVNVPSKTLGELAEAAWHPGTVDAATLNGWRESGQAFRLFDSRPPAEHSKMRPPGSVCLPNGELAHRFGAAVGDPAVPVVIHCAGRTRSITGAIGLRLAGVTNPVFALENGTQGWTLAGLQLERGAAAQPYPHLGEAARSDSRERAMHLMRERHIPVLDHQGLEAMRSDPSRTLYVFDVRSGEEYGAGHLPGAVQAPGGQLVQASDQWIGVRHARVVLCDDTGMRAALAAFWLRQLGWEVYVLAEAMPGGSGRDIAKSGRYRPAALPQIGVREAAAALQARTHILLDLRGSQAYRSGHPEGARWAIRPNVGGAAEGAKTIVLLADHPAIAELAGIDLAESGVRDVHVLAGGMQAWRDAGLAVETSRNRPDDAEAIDFLQFVHDRHDGNLESARRYLEWEQGLVAQLDAQERAEFRLERPA